MLYLGGIFGVEDENVLMARDDFLVLLDDRLIRKEILAWIVVFEEIHTLHRRTECVLFKDLWDVWGELAGLVVQRTVTGWHQVRDGVHMRVRPEGRVVSCRI